MRFTSDGVNIPDELLWAQDEGRVVFFCGAGVSMEKAGLPTFHGLTKKVLDGLAASPDDPARKLFELATAAAGITGLTNSDQVFQKLRRNFTVADIGAKVAECLKPPKDADLAAHRTILRLAKLQTGETRVVTTNFDLLFEQCNRSLTSVTRSRLPHLAFNKTDWGIVHLHGCVLPDYSGPTGDGFVLSSAEFGDAYLAMGWARNFVKEVLDRYVAVFVGYSADDPPVSYLLEGLQQSNGPANRAYAFQSGPDDQAAASWDEKGVEALLYPTDEGCGHRRLWQTLEAWSKRSADPIKWRKRVFDLAIKGPRKLEPHERGMITHIVGSSFGALAFANHRPLIPAEWLCVFDPTVRYGTPLPLGGRYAEGPVVDPFDRYRLDCDSPPREKSKESDRRPKDAWSAFELNLTDYRNLRPNQLAGICGYSANHRPILPSRLGALAGWIIAIADQPAAAWWAGHQFSLHYHIRDGIRISDIAKGSNANRAVAAAWQTVYEYHKFQEDENHRVYGLELKVEPEESREMLSREYADYFSPRLKLDTRWLSPVPPIQNRKLKRSELVNVDVEYNNGILKVKVPDVYLHSLVRKLRSCLEFAEELESRFSTLTDIHSIENDDADSDSFGRKYKLSGRVVAFADLFKRLATLSPKDAYFELQSWSRNSPVFERLRIWAMGNLCIVPARDFADELLALTSKSFWPFRGERDLLLGLSKRWIEFDVKRRKALEKRIRQGPAMRRGDQEEIQRAAHWQLSRLNWLKARGCDFTFDLDKVNTALQVIAPNWKPEFAAHAADTRDGKSGWVQTDTDFSDISELPPEDIVQRIMGLQKRTSTLVERDPFLGLSKVLPNKALSALCASYKAKLFVASFWRSLLRPDIREADTVEFTHEIANALIGLAKNDFGAILRSASDWYEKHGLDLLPTYATTFETLWEKFLDSLRTISEPAETRVGRAPDWVTESINSPAGNLTEMLIVKLSKASPEAGSGFPQPWLARVEQLLALPGDSRRYALVIVSFQLVWFFHIDPTWTTDHILNVVDDPSMPDTDREAIWAGFFWSARVPQKDVFKRLKPHLLRLVQEESEQRDRHLEVLAGILLAGWGAWKDREEDSLVSSAEMRAALLESDNEFRKHVLWTMERMSNVDEISSARIVDFLIEVWPKQKSIRTPETSAILCQLALSQERNFVEVAELVSALVSKVGDDRVFIHELGNIKESEALQHPEAMLGLLYAVLPENRSRWPYGADTAFKELAETHPFIRSDPRFIELEGKPL